MLTEGLLQLNNPKVAEIVCLGLGSIGESVISRYQLSLLLYLKERFKINVSLYDPQFTKYDCDVLNTFDVKILETNLEGKYPVNVDSATFFYLPHCPKQLTNNLLWKNWGLRLCNCVLIANSFDKILERHSKRSLALNVPYIANILPHTTELTIINEFKYFDVFSDTSIHVFPINKLNLLPEDFWDNCIEPEYDTDDLEFITDNSPEKLIA